MALIGTTGGETWPPVTDSKGDPTVKLYEVVINGMQTTVQLTDDDAKRRGLKPKAAKAEADADDADDAGAKQPAAPANKGGSPAGNK